MNDSVNNSKIPDSNTPAPNTPDSDVMHDVWVATGYGKQLTQKNMPVPQPDPHDVVINVRAASLNPVDQKILDGQMRALMSFEFPLIPGSDGAGIVSQVGSEVTRFKPGDLVFFRAQSDRLGAFAPFFATHEDTVALAPQGMSFTDAASLPLVGLTAWQALTEKAEVKPGDRAGWAAWLSRWRTIWAPMSLRRCRARMRISFALWARTRSLITGRSVSRNT